MAPNGMKITIRSNNMLSFPLNLLLRISIIAIIGISKTNIKINGTMKNRDNNTSILYVFIG